MTVSNEQNDYCPNTYTFIIFVFPFDLKPLFRLISSGAFEKKEKRKKAVCNPYSTTKVALANPPPCAGAPASPNSMVYSPPQGTRSPLPIT